MTREHDRQGEQIRHNLLGVIEPVSMGIALARLILYRSSVRAPVTPRAPEARAARMTAYFVSADPSGRP